MESESPTTVAGKNPIPETGYDRRYLAGIALFNRGEYFDAHEVWEELWQDCPAADRRFYQALIQAAVAVYHFDRGNHTGAARLFRSGKRYAESYRPTYHALDLEEFWQRLEAYLAASLTQGVPISSVPRPTIALSPTPAGSS